MPDDTSKNVVGEVQEVKTSYLVSKEDLDSVEEHCFFALAVFFLLVLFAKLERIRKTREN